MILEEEARLEKIVKEKQAQVQAGCNYVPDATSGNMETMEVQEKELRWLSTLLDQCQKILNQPPTYLEVMVDNDLPSFSEVPWHISPQIQPPTSILQDLQMEVFNMLHGTVDVKRSSLWRRQMSDITGNVLANDSFEYIRADANFQAQDIYMTASRSGLQMKGIRK